MLMMMMIAFITIKSSLVPLIESLCAQIDMNVFIDRHECFQFFITCKKDKQRKQCHSLSEAR